MLTPQVLDYILDSLSVHKRLQESIIRDIVRRIIKSGVLDITESIVYQAERLQASGIVYDDILKIVSDESQSLYADVKFAFDSAETEIFNYDDELILKSPYSKEAIKSVSPAMKNIWSAALKKTFTDAENLTKTIANTSQTAFISACDLAHMQIASGSFSYTQAIANAIKQASNECVRVTYPSGASANVEYAVRRAVLTGVNQTASQIMMDKANELNHDLMQTTAHYGAREEHAVWQGLVVSMSGAKGYLSLSDVGYGSVTGIFGANCNHSWFLHFGYSPYTPEMLYDMKNKTVTLPDGKEVSYYQATQKQRGYERQIKASKRQLVALDEAMKNLPQDKALNVKSEFDYVSRKLKTQEARLANYCKQTGLKRDKFREQAFVAETENGIKNFGKSTSQKAVWAKRKALTANKTSDIIRIDKQFRIPQVPSSDVVKKIQSGEYNTKLSIQQYNKHIEGTPQFEKYKASRQAKGGNPQSIITISASEAQKIIQEKAGTGIVKVDRNGSVRSQECITCDNVIGLYFGGGEYHKTNKAKIHYGNKYSHIVPIRGDNYD